jgi:hypothetical protein
MYCVSERLGSSTKVRLASSASGPSAPSVCTIANWSSLLRFTRGTILRGGVAWRRISYQFIRQRIFAVYKPLCIIYWLALLTSHEILVACPLFLLLFHGSFLVS